MLRRVAAIAEERSVAADRDLVGVAEFWESYSNAGRKWAVALRRFGELGGVIEYWCGVPGSASAIPLTFSLYGPDGQKFACTSRLKDIRAAISDLEQRN